MSLLLLGLGNPGSNFFYTRHNVGFLFLDFIANKNGLKFKKIKNYEYAELNAEFEKIILVKPLTYMNLSGEVLSSVFSKFYVKKDSLVVIVDNIDLILGRCRFRRRGGASSHNGLKSISQNLGTNDYSRLYIGIGNCDNKSNKDFVLSKFSSGELLILKKILGFLYYEIIYLNEGNFNDKVSKINSCNLNAK